MDPTAVIGDRFRRLNARSIDEVSQVDSDYAQEHQVYIFNVWHLPHIIDSVPGLGSVRIPECPKGERYSKPYICPGRVAEHYDTGEGHMPYRMAPARGYQDRRTGRYIPGTVDDILKTYAQPGIYSANLVQWGCFAAEGKEPTEAELKTAHGALERTALLFVKTADELVLQGDMGKRQINAVHRELAKMLLANRKIRTPNWMEEQAPDPLMEDCPICGSLIKMGVLKCPICREWIRSLDDADGAPARHVKPKKSLPSGDQP